jgi:hypothetical protein
MSRSSRKSETAFVQNPEAAFLFPELVCRDRTSVGLWDRTSAGLEDPTSAGFGDSPYSYLGNALLGISGTAFLPLSETALPKCPCPGLGLPRRKSDCIFVEPAEAALHHMSETAFLQIPKTAFLQIPKTALLK